MLPLVTSLSGPLKRPAGRRVRGVGQNGADLWHMYGGFVARRHNLSGLREVPRLLQLARKGQVMAAICETAEQIAGMVGLGLCA